jgi:ribose transport system permease protein
MTMGRAWLRWLSEYGILGVLVLVCAALSLATISQQYPTGAPAARDVDSQIQSGTSKVAIIASSSVDDLAFAEELSKEMQARGMVVAVDVRGEPRDARKALERLAASGRPVDVIACTPTTANWLVITDLASDFPTLAPARVLGPRSYWWPNFLRRNNLLNVANQIAVIAIVAIGRSAA